MDSGRRPAPRCQPSADSKPATARAVTPVVGAVLLLAATVLLLAAVVPFVLSLSNNTGEGAPDTEFTFVYSEDVPQTRTDSFGTAGTEPGATGLVTLTIESGERINASRLTVETDASGGTVLDGTDIVGTNATLGPGDTLQVWAGRGDRVAVVWTAADGGDSETLASFEVRPRDLLPVGIPDPERECPYIASQTPGDVTVDGVVVRCDLNEYDVDDISLKNDGVVIGVVEGDGTLNSDDSDVYLGNVLLGADGSDGDIDIKSGSEINTNVVARGGGSVDIGGTSTVGGSVTANGAFDIDGNSTVRGDVAAGADGSDGAIVLTTGSRVGGGLTTPKSVDADSDSSIGGSISAGLGVYLDDVTTGSSVDAGGQVQVQGGTSVGGPIVADAQVQVKSQSTVDGSVDSETSVGVKGDSAVSGSIDAKSQVQIQRSDVAGSVDGETNVQIQYSTVGGSVESQKETTVRHGSTVDGPVDSEDYVQVQNGSVVDGSIESTSETLVEGDSAVDGSVDSETKVRVQNNGTVEGSITARENVQIQGGSTVNGTIDGQKQVEVQYSSVAGNVEAANGFSCSNSTINGANCSQYKKPKFNITILNTNSPVSAGDTLTVEANIQNTRYETGTRNVTLEIDGDVTDFTNLTLDGRQSTNETFSWTTDPGNSDRGDHTATVTTDNGRDVPDSRTVTVN